MHIALEIDPVAGHACEELKPDTRDSQSKQFMQSQYVQDSTDMDMRVWDLESCSFQADTCTQFDRGCDACRTGWRAV